jgi:hypothetical protein
VIRGIDVVTKQEGAGADHLARMLQDISSVLEGVRAVAPVGSKSYAVADQMTTSFNQLLSDPRALRAYNSPGRYAALYAYLMYSTIFFAPLRNYTPAQVIAWAASGGDPIDESLALHHVRYQIFMVNISPQRGPSGIPLIEARIGSSSLSPSLAPAKTGPSCIGCGRASAATREPYTKLPFCSAECMHGWTGARYEAEE